LIDKVTGCSQQIAAVGLACHAVLFRAAVCNQAEAKSATSVANGDFLRVCAGTELVAGRISVEANIIVTTAIGANAATVVAGSVLAARVVIVASLETTKTGGHRAGGRACPQRGDLGAIGK
jgi:hypothetical protein